MLKVAMDVLDGRGCILHIDFVPLPAKMCSDSPPFHGCNIYCYIVRP